MKNVRKKNSFLVGFCSFFEWKLSLVLAVFLVAHIPSSLAEQGEKMAPDFVLKSDEGRNVRLSELRGDVVMINFWASWCGPCRQEMPKLDELHEKYKDMGFTVLGINVEQDNSKAKEMLEKSPVNFPILYDTLSEVTEKYNVDSMPMTLLLDADGKVRFLHKGYKPGYEDRYQAEMKTLFKEQYVSR